MRRFLLALALLFVAGGAFALAAVSWVSTTKGARVSSGTSPITVSATTTATAGNFLTAVLSTFNSTTSGPCPTVATPSGWTLANTPTCTTSRNEQWVFTKVATGNDSITANPTWAGGTQYTQITVLEWLGSANALDTISASTGGSGTTSIIAPAPGNTTVANDMIVAFWMNGTQASTGVTCTAPCTGTYTFDQEAATDTPPNNTWAFALQPPAGVVNPPSTTYASAPSSYQATTFTVKAAATPSGTVAYLLPAMGVGGTVTTTPAPAPPTPAAGTPPPLEQQAWWKASGVNDNTTISLANLQKYGPTWCNGSGTSSGAGAPTQQSCRMGGEYMSANMQNPSYQTGVNGGIGAMNQNPWRTGLSDNGSGLCPSAAQSGTAYFKQSPGPYDKTSSDTTKNWFVYPANQTVGGNDAGIGAGYGYSGNAEYNIFPNLLSTTLQNYVANYYKGCNDSNGLSLDKNTFEFEDNTFIGGASNGWNVWGGPAFSSADGGYTQHRNWGSRTDGTPFGSMSCNGGLPGVFVSGVSGTPCTVSTQLQTTEGVAGNYGNNTANTDNAYVQFFGAIKHQNGTPHLFEYNGFFNTDLTLLKSPSFVAGVLEEYLIGFCTSYTATTNGCTQHIGPNKGAWYILDDCAATGNNTTGKTVMPLNDAPSLNPLSAAAQWNQRIIWGTAYACEQDSNPDLVVMWNNLEGGQTIGTQQNDVFAGGFIRPYNRVGESFLQDVAPVGTPCARNSLNTYSGTNTPCTSGGAADTVMAHSATGGACGANNAACLDTVEFTHAYAQNIPNLLSWPGSFTYTGGNTVEDLGNFAVVYNLTGSAVTITSTLLNSILTNASQYSRVVAFCQPSGYFNTSGSGNIYVVNSTASNTVCGNNSGYDALNGGNVDNTTLLTSVLNEQLEPNDVLVLTGSTPLGYTYAGVPIFPSNDWFTTNLQTGGSTYAVNTVDANSTAILNNLSATYGTINWYSPAIETVNLANNSTTMTAVNGTTLYDPLGLDASNKYPITSPEYEEAAASGDCTGDCHDITLNTVTGADYEVYKSGSRNWNGTSFTTQSGYVHGVYATFDSQYSGDGSKMTGSGLPLMGTTAWGEDIAYQNAGCQPNCYIPHILGIAIPQQGRAIGGNYVNPATASETACTLSCTNKAYYGMRLRLKASFVCPSYVTNPQANLICNTAKVMGMIVTDTVGSASCTANTTGAGACTYSVRFGTDNNTVGTNPWSGDGCCGSTPVGDLDDLLMTGGAHYMALNSTNFDIMTLGTIH